MCPVVFVEEPSITMLLLPMVVLFVKGDDKDELEGGDGKEELDREMANDNGDNADVADGKLGDEDEIDNDGQQDGEDSQEYKFGAESALPKA